MESKGLHLRVCFDIWAMREDRTPQPDGRVPLKVVQRAGVNVVCVIIPV